MSTTVTRRALVLAAVLLTLVVQLVVLYAPSAPGPQSPIPHGDKLVHAIVFAAPVLVCALGPHVRWQPVALGCTVHAPASEVIQHAVLTQRSGDPWDVLADLVGVGAAAFGVSWWLRRPRRRRL